MKRIVIIGSALVILAACGGGDDAIPPAGATSAAATPSPTPTPDPPSCDKGEAAADRIFAGGLVLVNAEGQTFNRTVQALKRDLMRALYLVHDVESYLEDHGAYEGGDACLTRIAAAHAVTVEAIGLGEDTAARAYRLLLDHYPQSDAANDAEAFLRGHGYPIP